MKSLLIVLFSFFYLIGISTTITVCNSCNINSLETAIKVSQPYDLIIIEKGIYPVNFLIIDKPLTIKGEIGAIIDGNNKGEIFTLRSDNITIESIEFRNVGTSYTKDYAAISSDHVKNITIKNNRFHNSFFGVYLRKSKRCTISNNWFESNAKEEMSSGNAIHLWHCDSILIEENEISKHRDGIYLEFVSHSTISKNRSFNNLRYGLHFMFSDNNDYYHNTFENNGAGVAVMYSKLINMKHNTFINNWGPSSYGLLLKDITDGEISMNKFQKNTTAIYAEGAIRLAIEKNEFTSNGWAIKMLSSSMENTIKFNNFFENTFSVFTNSSKNYNDFSDNYWSSYQGYDLNKDGIGDVPHRPVSLFTYLVEQCEPALLLLKSNLIQLLEIAEKALPSITPENLVDESPRMTPYGY